MGLDPTSLIWCLIFTGLFSAVVECSASGGNPKIVHLTFQNDSQPSADLPDRLYMKNAPASERPLVLCMDAGNSADVYCNIQMLLEDGAFPRSMGIIGVNAAVTDPAGPGKSCVLEFTNMVEKNVNPFFFNKIQCGLEEEITPEDSPIVPRDTDSAVVLREFKAAKITEFVLISYTPGHGCKHRLRRFHDNVEATKKQGPSIIFELDTFFCSAGFGSAERRPETRYPPRRYYKSSGNRLIASGTWPDYV